MAAWSSRKLVRDVFLRRVALNPLPGFRCFSSSAAPESAPKIGHHSKKVCFFLLLLRAGVYFSYALSCWYVGLYCSLDFQCKEEFFSRNIGLEDARFVLHAAISKRCVQVAESELIC